MNNEVMEIKINEHTEEIKEHDRRLDKIEQDGREFRTEIKNLCKDLKGLTVTIRWFMGLLVGSFVGFFFYAIQHGLFK
ncbi:hemolysin XhlA family protein [Clostridium sp. KNHs214]|uniref:hemolysin XhlA family protein n=1 Tax=Clostridium sp. KNHs214 TaxID=1540257 RepID=UPI000557085D|nr:hemolysin XhlA family protein [Clostridium sp. KNHs214]